MEREFYRPEEVAEKLGIKVSTVRRWIFDRRLSVIKLGRSVRIPATEVDRIIRTGIRPAIVIAGSRNPL